MEYPNQRLLVTVDWLRDNLNDESLVVFDVRAGVNLLDYLEGHIPGALPFSLAHAQGVVGGTPGCLIEAALVHQLSTLGVHPEQTVVLYDEEASTTLTQSFWACERIGQREVRLLAGGLRQWKAAGGPVTRRVPQRAPSAYRASPRPCAANAEWIAQHAGDVQLLDTRGPQEWRAGHIAGAVNFNWSNLACTEQDVTTFLPAPKVQTHFDALGLSPEQETVTYCRTGGRASFVYFMLRLMGWQRARNFDGSLTEWLLQERPVER